MFHCGFIPFSVLKKYESTILWIPRNSNAHVQMHDYCSVVWSKVMRVFVLYLQPIWSIRKCYLIYFKIFYVPLDCCFNTTCKIKIWLNNGTIANNYDARMFSAQSYKRIVSRYVYRCTCNTTCRAVLSKGQIRPTFFIFCIYKHVQSISHSTQQHKRNP
jgi:hypothetical protein